MDLDDHYRIRLQFHSSFPSTYQNAIRAAADTWETILADTELPSIHWARPLSCLGFSTEENPGSVDDLLILVAADSIGAGMAGISNPRQLWLTRWTHNRRRLVE